MSLAKHVLNIAVIFALLFSSFRISFTYVYYYLDPGGFTEMLCENKDKPELECNGKCYLKKIVSNEKQENKAPLSEIEYKDLLLIVQDRNEIIFNAVTMVKDYFDTYENSYKYLLVCKLFHPPQKAISFPVNKQVIQQIT
ncbi:MAG: hypothetical protein DWP94_08495 [Flavobacterium sp.]|nr:MAG: hypothetical protein DWP94_08495 [Flavobacterium sp.]